MRKKGGTDEYHSTHVTLPSGKRTKPPTETGKVNQTAKNTPERTHIYMYITP